MTNNKISIKLLAIFFMFTLLFQVMQQPVNVSADEMQIENILKKEEQKSIGSIKNDLEFLTLNEKGEVLYNGEPLYVVAGVDYIPAKLDDLMKQGVRQELVTKKQTQNKGMLLRSVRTSVSSTSSAPYVEYLGTVSYKHAYGTTTMGDFRVNGQQAYCIENFVPSPPTGTPYNEPTPYENAKIARALYYGWGGPGSIFGTSESNRIRGVIVTSGILSKLYHGEHLGGEFIPGWNELWDKVQNGTMPYHQINLLNPNPSVNVKNGKQVSETTTFSAYKDNTITFSLPSSVTLVNESTGKHKTGGSVTIKGGEKFHLEAPLNYGGTIDTGNIYGSIQKFQPLLLKPKAGDYQTLGMWELYIDPTETARLKATFVKREKNVTVSYYDERTGQKLKPSKTYKKIIGDSYSETPDKITKDGYTYRYVRTDGDKQSGVIGSKDIVINYYYDKPLIKAALEKIQIYTADSSDGLPVKVYLSKVNNYSTSVKDFTNSNKMLTVALYQGNSKYAEKKYTAANLPELVTFTVPADKLKDNEHKPYTVKLEGNKNDFDIPSGKGSVTTDGYTSSKKVINVDAAKQKKVEYKGVVMTEREVGKNMVVHYETLDIPVKPLERMRTGYGFEMPIAINYVNEIGPGDTKFALNMIVPNAIVDESYIEYPTQDGSALVPLEQTKDNTSTKNNIKKSEQLFELQHVNVEHMTGALFSDEQVRKKDPRIKNELREGYRKFYLPIWGYVGNYPVQVQSTKDIGVNKINFKINHNLEVFAHMYAHMDSETIKDDAILFEPVNGDDPYFPDSWTEEEKKVYFEWNEESKKDHEKGTIVKSKINPLYEFFFN